MYRPGYGVLTSVLFVLGLLALLRAWLAPRIPPLPENRMGREHDEFLREGRFEPINWKSLSLASFAEARREGRPVLLVIGTPSSAIGQNLDHIAFRDPEVAAYLDRRFACMRIDGAAHPEWLNAMWPLTRLSVRFQPDLQLWALDGEGRVFDFYGRMTGDENFSVPSLLGTLIRFRHDYDDLSDLSSIAILARQSRDLDRLSESATRTPMPLSLYTESLKALARRGNQSPKYAALTPFVWRYLAMAGETKYARDEVDRILRSPMRDLLDGGFFHTMLTTDPPTVEFDKQAVENADTMLALAQIDAMGYDPLAREAAVSVWQYLAVFAHNRYGFVYGQLSQDVLRLRSRRYSVSAKRLRDSVGPELRQWGVAELGLDVAKYRQAVPFLQRATAVDARVKETMQALAATAGPPAPTVEVGLADVGFTCAARAIQTARLWGDNARLTQAVDWLDAMESLRTGADILRGSRQNGEPGYLGDYLAYADARLQDYLATGRVPAFEQGLRVLQRARALFRGSRPGLFLLKRRAAQMPIVGLDVPELADNERESCTARAVRLMMAYGRLLGDTPAGIDLRREALTAVRVFGPLAAPGQDASAGFFCAAAGALDGTYAIVIGPDSQPLADSLQAALPNRLVAAAHGPVHPELQDKNAGIYIMGAKAEGPFTLAEARARLSPFLRTGS